VLAPIQLPIIPIMLFRLVSDDDAVLKRENGLRMKDDVVEEDEWPGVF
jgi:hypothetical protein